MIDKARGERLKLETIEQKTYRLGKLTIPAWDRDAFPTFEESLEDDYFISACKMIEMAIAEEREACVQRASLWTVQGRYMSTRLHAEMLSAIRDEVTVELDNESENE